MHGLRNYICNYINMNPASVVSDILRLWRDIPYKISE